LARFLKALAPAIVAAALIGCGSSNNNSGPVSLRFVNASTNQSLTVSLNGTVQFSTIAAGASTSYSQVAAGTYTITISSASGALASASLSAGLGSNSTFTLVGYTRNGAIVAYLVTEDQTVPVGGLGTIGVANISPDAGALDVYLVTPGTTSLSGLTPQFPFANFAAVPVFTTLVAGTFDVVATASGNPNDVRLRLPSVQVAAGQVRLVAFTNTPGGALVNAVILNQAGTVGAATVQYVNNTQARVRIASALPTAGLTPVAGTVGSQALATVYSPNPGSYTEVAGNTSTYTISANGAAVAGLPAATFAVGGDYTILVYGAAATPTVAVFTDNNQVPAGGNANLRLINAGANISQGLTMYYNNVQVANSILYGQASAYFGVAQSALATLQLIAPGMNPVSATVSLNSPGAVYTVFVIDSTLTPYLIRDR